MKLDDDFNSMFMILDTKRKGFLTGEEILNFYQTLMCQTVSLELVNTAIKKSCPSQQCKVKDFENVLILLEEWRQRETNAYWDFLTLDNDGSKTITMSKALFLARSVKEKEFSLQTWNEWKTSRDLNDTKVSWEEFKEYLYYEPKTQQSSLKNDAEYNELQQAVSKEESSKAIDDYHFYKASLEDDDSYSNMLLRERQQYQEDVQWESNRLLNRWNIGGVEAVIHDDGMEWEVEDKKQSQDDVNITELLAAVDEKYDLLRDKLIWETVKAQNSKENNNRKATFSELQEVFAEVKSREKELRKQETLEIKIKSLYGSDVSHRVDLRVLMGETADAYQVQWEELKRRFATYKSEGRTTKEINMIFEEEYANRIKDSETTGGGILIELWRRQKEERSQLMESLKRANSQTGRLAQFTALYRQCERAREGMVSVENHGSILPFDGSASGVAVAEREQVYDPSRFTEDATRQERFASERLKLAKQQGILKETPTSDRKMTDVSQAKDLGVVASWMEITKLMEKKHRAEREMLIHFLLTIGGLEKSVHSMDVKQQENRKRELTKAYEDWKTEITSSSSKISKRHYQLALLHEGVALYKETLKRVESERKEADISAVALSRLQVLQDIQFLEVQEQLKKMSILDIYKLRKTEYRALRDEYFENISALIFATEKLTAEEQQLVDVILKKYDLLRDKLFRQNIKSFNDEKEFTKMLNDLKEEEMKNRNNPAALQALCKKFQINLSANEILGPSYSRFFSASATNRDAVLSLTIDESTLVEKKESDILSELDARFCDESETILSRIKDSDDAVSVVRQEIDKQLWEITTLDRDSSFLPSAITLGLMQRKQLGEKKIKLTEDTTRFIICAQKRFSLPEPFNESSSKNFSTDRVEANEAMQLLTSRHIGEWKQLRSLMSDVTAEELREAASLMTSDERVKRLAEINAKRKSIDITNQDEEEDLLSLLEEAAALKHICRKDILLHLAGESGASDENVYISLLADLNEEQISDGMYWFNDIMKNNVQEVSSGCSRIKAHMDACENVFEILCKYEGSADDAHLLQALEDKYDALRDKLLSDALMRQMGEDAWRRLSEKQRQAKLLKLKLEEARLRKEGNMDELARLLGDAFANDARLKGLLGERRDEFEQKLKERLAARQRGETISEDETDEDAITLNGENNPLVDLASRLEDEREALMKMLSGQSNVYLSEKERQMALLRMRQSRLKAEGEDRYDAAALVSGLVDREAANEKRKKSDRERQRELARQRLEELRKRGGRLPVISEEEDMIVRDRDRAVLEEAVLKKLRFLQKWERAWMTKLLETADDPLSLVGMTSMQQISDKLQECRSRVPSGAVVLQKYLNPLSDAALYRQVASARHVTEPNSQSKDEIKLSVFAEFQEAQDSGEALMSVMMTEMNDKELIKEQEKLLSIIKSESSENVPVFLFSSTHSLDSKQEMMDALQGKYDAVIDALAARVLPQKVGISKWNSMLPEEKQTKISDLSARIKELMAAGRYDDAFELLGEGLSEDERRDLINMFLGDVQERKKDDLKERERKKEERIQNGMSSKDADRLFAEEELLFEEQEKRRRRNILEGLAMDLDAEKAAHLKALKDAKDRFEAERKRQLLLAKLRLEERQLRREADLSAIGKLLAMANDQQAIMEKERQRHLALARDRIEAMKRKRAAGIADEENDEVEGELRLDSDDVVVLADVVMREMEAKHASERTALLKLMELCAPGTDVRVKTEETSSSVRRKRINELREMRKQWRDEDPETMLETKEEHWEILKEATAIQLTSYKQPADEVESHLLADLQIEQKKETTMLFTGLLDKKPETVRKIAEVQRQARNQCWHDNVARSLLGSTSVVEASEDDKEVVKALEEKYDALKDKLLAEALMKKLGEKEWASLSERERQHRIMQIKQNERKLRREGKHDEVAKLFHALAITEKDINRIFGEERISQEEALKKRRKRIIELRKERKEKGLSIDDETIEKQVDEEEKVEKQKRTNILLTLDRNFDSEREALLSSLKHQEELISEERRRQIAVAKLRRQRRQVEAQDKINALSFMFQTAKQNEKALLDSQTADRERQIALAKERLGVKKTQKQRKQAVASLTDPSVIFKRLVALGEANNEGSSTERLLFEMERKHLDEKETLDLLLLAMEDDSIKKKNLSKMSDQKLYEEIENFSKRRREWREERMMRAIKENSGMPLANDQRQRLSGYVADCNKDLIAAAQLKLEALSREHREEENNESSREAIKAEWIAELDRTQENEINITSGLIADKTEEIIELLTQDQKRARREGWDDNIAQVVFHLALPGQEQHRPPSTSSSIDQEVQDIENEAEEKMKKIEEELKEEKKKIERRRVEGEEVDADAAYSELEKQFANKKAALTSDIERQRKQVREKLRERRQRKAESEYEAHAAVGMVLLAEQRLKMREDQTKSEASKQKSLMQQRLAARREKRKMEQEKKIDTSKEEEEEKSSEKIAKDPAARDGEMKVMSDTEKKALLASMSEEARKYQEKIDMEKQKQKEMVQRRIEEAKRRQENIAGGMVREYTIVQEKRTERLERQKTEFLERLQKLKTDRTMTMKDNRNKKRKEFSKMMNEGDLDEMDQNQKMAMVAEQLQEKFVKEKEKMSTLGDTFADFGDSFSSAHSSTEVPSSDNASPRPQTASRKLDRQERSRIINERRQKRKNKRNEQEGAVPIPDEEEPSQS